MGDAGDPAEVMTRQKFSVNFNERSHLLPGVELRLHRQSCFF